MNVPSYIDSDQNKAKKFKKGDQKNKVAMYGDSGDNSSGNGTSCNFATRFQEVVLGGLEKFFYNYGKFVAR